MDYSICRVCCTPQGNREIIAANARCPTCKACDWESADEPLKGLEKLIVRTATVAWCALAYVVTWVLVEGWCRFFHVTGAQVFHVVVFVGISLLVWQWPTDDVPMRRRASRVIHGCVIGLSVLVIFWAFRYVASLAFVQWLLGVLGVAS